MKILFTENVMEAKSFRGKSHGPQICQGKRNETKNNYLLEKKMWFNVSVKLVSVHSN